MLIILIDRWQVLSYLIRMPLLNQANHAIWQKSWSTSIVLTVFPWILEVNASKEEKKACPFSYTTPRRKKTTKSFCKEWASNLAESDKGAYYNVTCFRLSDSGEDAKVKPLLLCPVSSRFTFVIALSQFSRPNYLGAWNRLTTIKKNG